MFSYRHPAAVAIVAMALCALSTAAPGHAADKPRPAPPVKPASAYAAHEIHANEHVTIAAEPCDDPDNCKFFRLQYVQHGFLPVRVVVTNDRDQPLLLDDVRIQFLPAAGDKLPAATDEDINRRLFSRKSAAGTKLPIIPITIHHEAIDKQVTNDGNDFGFKSLTVPPHTTAAGYVFYDIRPLDEPVLKDAELYVKMIHTTNDKGDKQELFGFSIPFNKWLHTQSEPIPTPAHAK